MFKQWMSSNSFIFNIWCNDNSCTEPTTHVQQCQHNKYISVTPLKKYLNQLVLWIRQGTKKRSLWTTERSVIETHVFVIITIIILFYNCFTRLWMEGSILIQWRTKNFCLQISVNARTSDLIRALLWPLSMLKEKPILSS